MAKAGVTSRQRGTRQSGAATREGLIEAAITTLKTEGFAGTSARVIAKNAGCNQALVFYHFGSVVDLLLAALDEVSARRQQRYRAAAAGISSPRELVAVAAEVFAEDMDNGDITVLSELIGGASATPGLGPAVAARVAPWQTAERTIAAGLGNSPLGSLVPVGDLSHAVVALYLGLELLSHLDGDRSRAVALFDHALGLAAIVEALAPPSPNPSTKEQS